MAGNSRPVKSWCALRGAALLMACGGKSVDLGQRDAAGFADLADEPQPAADGSPSPQTIYEAEARVIAFTVDETNLWASIDVADGRRFRHRRRSTRAHDAPAPDCAPPLWTRRVCAADEYRVTALRWFKCRSATTRLIAQPAPMSRA
jgi:hypothetical protein